MIQPLVSIIITSYNRAGYIEKAIQSALEQDYANLEIVISDNKSTDNTDAVIKKYTSDERIKYFANNENIGMIPNFKLATEERAKGEFITYLSSDDYFCSNQFISSAVSLINKYPDIVLVAAKNYTLFNEINELKEDDNGYVYQNEFKTGEEMFGLFPQWFAPGWGAVVMHRQKLINTKAFESKAQSIDYEANLKLMLQGNVAFIQQPSYVFRRHAMQASGSMDKAAQINNLDFIENTYEFAKKINYNINIEKWRQQVYYSYLNGVARRLITKKEELTKILAYVKTEKKISISFIKSPKYFILFTIYKNYDKISFLLRWFYPGLYKSIEKDK
jgi:glycosyltransferase involved in cell wall biosynthesis